MRRREFITFVGGAVFGDPMSAIGPKQTCVCALQESGFGVRADMLLREFRFCGRYWV
jgi:hypothetical protein